MAIVTRTVKSFAVLMKPMVSSTTPGSVSLPVTTPVSAVLVGIVGDIVGAAIFSAGDFYFGYTLTAALTDLFYGVDEGRILCGNAAGKDSDALPSRTVGDTYQAAFDARLIKQMFDSGMNYFSSWEYCSMGENHGNPIITYFVAKHAADFEGARLASAEKTRCGGVINADINASAAFDETSNTLRIMAYNYKNKVNYLSNAQLTFKVNAPQFADGEA